MCFDHQRPRGILLVLLLAGTMLAGLAPGQVRVTVAGSLQDEMGCSTDWDPACATLDLVPRSVPSKWSETFDVPAGTWEYKIAIDGSWSESHPAGNVLLHVPVATRVRFEFYSDTNTVADSVNERVVSLTGDFQRASGCSSDWDLTCVQTRMRDPSGDGTYKATALVPPGERNLLIALDESWSVVYGTGGLPTTQNHVFSPPPGGTTMVFRWRQNELLEVEPMVVFWDGFESGDLTRWSGSR